MPNDKMSLENIKSRQRVRKGLLGIQYRQSTRDIGALLDLLDAIAQLLPAWRGAAEASDTESFAGRSVEAAVSLCANELKEILNG